MRIDLKTGKLPTVSLPIRFLLTGIILLSTTLTSPAVAQDFRIETEVFQGDSTEPISENLTLFSGNLILDFMLPTDRSRFPEEIVVYQSREKQFVLLDTRRQTKAFVLEGDVLRIIAAMQSSNIGEDENDFLFHPTFDETYDPSSGLLSLESEQLSYHVKGHRPDDDNVLPRYFEFISQFARLNATDPRRMPPFARLKLNHSLKKFGFIPDEVELTLVPSLESHTEQIRLKTKHNVIWQLSEKDHQRVASAKRYWMEFEEVTLSEYRTLQQTAPALQQTNDGSTNR